MPSRQPATPSSDRQKKSKFWWPELDGLRTLAFLLVFYTHTAGLFPKETPGKNAISNFLFNLDHHIHDWGWIGVDLFFVLSAFLITSILVREREHASNGKINLAHFYTRRALRIWPLYFFYLALVFCTYPLLIGIQQQLGTPLSTAQTAPTSWIPHLLTFAAFVGNYAMVAQGNLVIPLNPLWSLCIEEQFYIVWGLVMWRAKSLQTVVSLIIAGLIGTVAIRTIAFIVAPGNHLAFYANGPARMDSILMGAGAAFLWKRYSNQIIASKRIQAVLATVAVVALTTVVAFVPPIEKADVSAIWALTAIATGWTCFLLATLSNRWLRAFFSTPLLTHVGKLTYGLYIFHVMVLAFLMVTARAWFDIHTQSQFVFVCWVFGLAITYGLARLSWRFIEKPCCDLKERFSHQG